MSATFVSSREVKACRKRHQCSYCGEHIEVGQPCRRHSGIWDGAFPRVQAWLADVEVES